MIEKYLIKYCSPTLASLKTASLFCCSFKNRYEFYKSVDKWNKRLENKGIRIIILKESDYNALVYVCRINLLVLEFKKPGVTDFLHSCGYNKITVKDSIEKLREKIKDMTCFPHEIGIFLGYPLGDVKGFIRNSGQNFKFSGCWKVYCNEKESVELFKKYKKCKEIYLRLWNQGRSILQLTVAL